MTQFIKGLLALIEVEDSPTYKRSKIINMQEDTQMVLSAAEFLDDETILKHLPFLSPDEIDEILERKDAEEAERYADESDGDDGESAILEEYGNDVLSMLDEILAEAQ